MFASASPTPRVSDSAALPTPWTYYPGIVAPELFAELASYFGAVCVRQAVGGRRMAVAGETSSWEAFVRADWRNARYRGIPFCDWGEVPAAVISLRDELTAAVGVTPDYVLVNIYDNGNDSIAWHSDREAMDSEILSVSLGETRTFRFRLIGQTKGWSHEFDLASGDVIHMHGPRPGGARGCQYDYEHCVPKRANKGPRLNLTFRQYPAAKR